MTSLRTMNGAPAHDVRTYRGNGARGPGAFTRGDRGSWGETACGIAPRPTVGLRETLHARPIARPYADLPDERERPMTGDGTVRLGRFAVRSIVPATPDATPIACGSCWLVTCECDRW